MSSNKYKDDERDLPKWDGSRGIAFERFVRLIRPILMGRFAGPTDDFSFWQAANGTDQGGDAAGAPMIPGGAGAAGATGKRTRRSNKLYAMLIEVCEDEKIRNMLLALPDGDVPMPGGGFQGIARRSWIVMVTHGQAPIDDEYTVRVKVIFNTVTILGSVGYDEGSIFKYQRYLSNLIFLVPLADRPTDNDYCLRVLDCLGKEAPDALALEAVKEFKAAAADRRFVLAPPAAAGTRNLAAIVLYFGDLWDHGVRQGKITKKSAGVKAASATVLSATVDPDEALAVEGAPPGGSDQCQDIDSEDISTEAMVTLDVWNSLVESAPEILVSMYGTSPDTPLHMEAICPVCFGAGHSDQCPSEPRHDRNAESVQGILARIAKGRGRGRGGDRAMVSASRGRGRFYRPRAAPITPLARNPLNPSRSSTPNRRRPGARPPFGSTPGNAGRRVSVARLEEEGNVAETEAPEFDETMLDDLGIMCVSSHTRARVQVRSVSSESAVFSANTGASAPAGLPPIAETSDEMAVEAEAQPESMELPSEPSIKALKLVLFSVSMHNETMMMIHTRLPGRGGNLDLPGVAMVDGETLSEAVHRCIMNELDDHHGIHEAAEMALEHNPTGHANFEMRIHGFLNDVTVVCVDMQEADPMPTPVTEVWADTHIEPESTQWWSASEVYHELALMMRPLAQGIRAGLVRAGCVDGAEPRSPEGQRLEQDPSQPDGLIGRFVAYTLDLETTLDVEAGVAECLAPHLTCLALGALRLTCTVAADERSPLAERTKMIIKMWSKCEGLLRVMQWIAGDRRHNHLNANEITCIKMLRVTSRALSFKDTSSCVYLLDRRIDYARGNERAAVLSPRNWRRVNLSEYGIVGNMAKDYRNFVCQCFMFVLNKAAWIGYALAALQLKVEWTIMDAENGYCPYPLIGACPARRPHQQVTFPSPINAHKKLAWFFSRVSMFTRDARDVSGSLDYTFRGLGDLRRRLRGTMFGKQATLVEYGPDKGESGTLGPWNAFFGGDDFKPPAKCMYDARFIGPEQFSDVMSEVIDAVVDHPFYLAEMGPYEQLPDEKKRLIRNGMVYCAMRAVGDETIGAKALAERLAGFTITYAAHRFLRMRRIKCLAFMWLRITRSSITLIDIALRHAIVIEGELSSIPVCIYASPNDRGLMRRQLASTVVNTIANNVYRATVRIQAWYRRRKFYYNYSSSEKYGKRHRKWCQYVVDIVPVMHLLGARVTAERIDHVLSLRCLMRSCTMGSHDFTMAGTSYIFSNISGLTGMPTNLSGMNVWHAFKHYPLFFPDYFVLLDPWRLKDPLWVRYVDQVARGLGGHAARLVTGISAKMRMTASNEACEGYVGNDVRMLFSHDQVMKHFHWVSNYSCVFNGGTFRYSLMSGCACLMSGCACQPLVKAEFDHEFSMMPWPRDEPKRETCYRTAHLHYRRQHLVRLQLPELSGGKKVYRLYRRHDDSWASRGRRGMQKSNGFWINDLDSNVTPTTQDLDKSRRITSMLAERRVQRQARAQERVHNAQVAGEFMGPTSIYQRRAADSVSAADFSMADFDCDSIVAAVASWPSLPSMDEFMEMDIATWPQLWHIDDHLCDWAELVVTFLTRSDGDVVWDPTRILLNLRAASWSTAIAVNVNGSARYKGNIGSFIASRRILANAYMFHVECNSAASDNHVDTAAHRVAANAVANVLKRYSPPTRPAPFPRSAGGRELVAPGGAGQFTEWVVDCGATKHTTPRLEDLYEAWPIRNNAKVRVGNGAALAITHIGNARVQAIANLAGNVMHEMVLTNVLVVPEIKPRLFSSGAGFGNDGIRTLLNEDCQLVTKEGDTIEFTTNPVHYSFCARVENDSVPTILDEINFLDADSYVLLLHAPVKLTCVRSNELVDGTARHSTSINLGTAAQPVAESDFSMADLRPAPDGANARETVHKRLAHFSLQRIALAINRSTGLDLSDFNHMGHGSSAHAIDCDACALNSRRASFSRKSRAQLGKKPRFSVFGQCVSSDLCMMPESIPHGFKYALVFLDWATGLCDVRFVKDKEPESVHAGLLSWMQEHKRELDANGGLGIWHTDNGGEFKDMAEAATSICRHTFSVPETPQDNGGAERLNGILIRQTRILLAAANLSDRLWPYAFKFVVQVHNSLPSRKHDPPISAYELVYHQLPNLDLLHTFGCKVFMPLSEREHETHVKTAPTNVMAVNLGFDRITRSFHLYVPQLKQFTTGRGLHFRDNEYFAPEEVRRNETYLKKSNRKEAETPEIVGTRTLGRHDGSGDAPEEQLDEASFAQGWNDPAVALSLALIAHADIPQWMLKPKSYEDAVHPDNLLRDKWIAGMVGELQGKMNNGRDGFARTVPDSEPRRNGRRPVKVKWVFDTKYTIDGEVREHKARLVMCGYEQIEGVDYGETFASTIRGVTVRAFFAMAAKFKLKLALGDVVKAFTQAEADRDIYGEMPKGFEMPGYVLLFKQSLEGAKQAAHLWQNLLSDVLVKELGFTRSIIDPCLYTRGTRGELNDDRMIVIVWVDDLAIAYSNEAKMDTFIERIQKHLKCTFEKGLNKYIGMEVTRDIDRGTITLTQTNYITKLFNRHMAASNAKGWKHMTPCGTSRPEATKFLEIKPTENEYERAENIKRGFLVLIGGIMYAMVFTRPDIAFHTSHLASCMQSPSTEAYEAALNLLRYMYHTKHMGITFGNIDPERTKMVGIQKSEPFVWADASFGGREFSPYGGGYVECHYGPLGWIARRLKFKPLSTFEAEVAALVVMLKEGMFSVEILKEMGFKIMFPVSAATDSKSAYDAIKNAGVTKNSVHFERWLHYARDLAMRNRVSVILVGTDVQMADDKTKVVDKRKFLACRRAQMNLPGNVSDQWAD